MSKLSRLQSILQSKAGGENKPTQVSDPDSLQLMGGFSHLKEDQLNGTCSNPQCNNPGCTGGTNTGCSNDGCNTLGMNNSSCHNTSCTTGGIFE